MEVGVALLIGALVGLLSMGAGRFRTAARLFEPVAALIAAFVATLAAAWLPGLSFRLATLAGVIILIPGLTLTVAMSELSTKHLVSGTARLAGAVTLYLTITFGAAVGNHFAGRLVGPMLGGDPVLLPEWTLAAALLVSPLAFVILFRAHARDAAWIVIAGFLGFAGANLGAAELGPELGVFVGAFAVGAAGNLYGRILKRPAQVLVVPGILMLVPGSVGFRSLTSLMDREVMLGVETAFTAVLMAVSLAAGLLVANALLPAGGLPQRGGGWRPRHTRIDPATPDPDP